MASLNDILQDLVNESDENKISLAVESYTALRPVFQSVDSEHNGVMAALAIIGAAIGADGKLAASELALATAILKAEGLNVSPEEAAKMVVAAIDEKSFGLAQVLSKALDDRPDKKASLVSLVAAISALDDTISPEENAFIQSLIN